MQAELLKRFSSILKLISPIPENVLESEIIEYLENNEPDLAFSNLIANIVTRNIAVTPAIFESIKDIG